MGVTAGAVVSLFRWLIAKGAAFSVDIYEDALHNPLLILGIVLVNLLIALFIGYLIKQEKDIKGSGIPHVEGELMGLLHPSWWSVLWRKFLGGVLGISMGLMLGREGPSIQLGAMTAKGLAKGLKLSAREKRVLIAAGAAAGLSAAFNAPIAGLFVCRRRSLSSFLSSCLGDCFNSIFSGQCCFSTHLWPGTGPCYDRKITRISFERLLDSYCFGDFSRCAWIRL